MTHEKPEIDFPDGPPPTFMPWTPWSQPAMTWPMPSLNWSGWPRLYDASNSSPVECATPT